MLLISKGMYETCYGPHGYLTIDPIDNSLFTPNCYYFRLGGIGEQEQVVPLKESVTLGKHEAKRVFSLETFSLSERVFAVIGPCSDLICKGLCLRNSPVIDPGFSGGLEMMIENLTDHRVSLEPAMVIGKAMFFDISETMIDLDKYVRLEKQKAVWVARKQAGEKIREAGIWIEKLIDTEAPKDM
jgi:deoxycytidine triphosphate deaminase